jgi:hypothetical protein
LRDRFGRSSRGGWLGGRRFGWWRLCRWRWGFCGGWGNGRVCRNYLRSGRLRWRRNRGIGGWRRRRDSRRRHDGEGNFRVDGWGKGGQWGTGWRQVRLF